jgi:hypothetical protein
MKFLVSPNQDYLSFKAIFSSLKLKKTDRGQRDYGGTTL